MEVTPVEKKSFRLSYFGPDFAGNGRWGMEKGGRVESLESGGRGVGTQDTAYAYASQARSRTRAGTKGRRDYTEHAGYDKR